MMDFHPEAIAELDEALAWYEAQQTGLSDAFMECLNATLGRIEVHPGLASRIDERLHRVLINRFPYAVIYSREPERIVVLAIAHLHRHPRHQRPQRR